MDGALCAAVLERLPTLEDGTTGKILAGIFGIKG